MSIVLCICSFISNNFSSKMEHKIWKIYWCVLLIHIKLFCVYSFAPQQFLILLKNHNSITRNAVQLIAAKWMNENPIVGSLAININFDSPMSEAAMFRRYYASSRKPPSSKTLSNAVSKIAFAAGDVDINGATKNNPAYHFDAEKFSNQTIK